MSNLETIVPTLYWKEYKPSHFLHFFLNGNYDDGT